MSEPAPAPQTAAQLIVGYFRDFGVLRETGREYWGIQIINFLDCTFYFAMLTIVTLFLSTDLGVSDEHAGYAVAFFTSAVTLLLTFSGVMTDWLGIRTSLRVTMGSMLVLRAAMVFVGLTPALPHRGWIATALLVLMAPFMAGIQTIFQAATQRYTAQRARSAGFNLWYLFMNIGAATGGAAVDIVRLKLKVANVHIFTMGVATAVLCLVFGELMVRREKQLRGAGEEPEPVSNGTGKRSPWRIFVEVVSERAFFRLLVLIALILGVRAVYTYLYLLMPKYWERTIGPDAAIGVLNMINPIGIVVGIILFIPFANRFKVFDLLVYGAMVSAFALFPMALPWQVYGGDIARSHYIMAILCMVIVTIGEVLWSPKLNEYTAAIAPKGQEGTYLGLSMIPWFLAKTLVSAFSGHMLTRWSPERVMVNGAEVPLKQALEQNQVPYWQSPAAMWLLLGAYAMVGCIIAVLLRNWLTRGAHWKPAPAAA
ncbi:MAG: MFS transporter [Opitutaceae bacterium]|nr:MFS transporter [Opitutaceae bacterium]